MVVTPAAQAASVDTSAWYVPVNRHSGKALDVYDLSTSDGARISPWDDHNGHDQQFRLADSDSGHVRLVDRAGNKAVDVLYFSTAEVAQWPDTGGTVGAGERISLPSHTTLDSCGTINVSGSGSGDYAPVCSRGTAQVDVQHLYVTGRRSTASSCATPPT